jgi:hypothetical protein
MALSTADFRLFDRLERAGAIGGDLDASPQSEKAGGYSGFEHHVGTGVRHQDTRHAAAGTQIRCVGAAAGCAIDQSALLPSATSMEILIVERTFRSSRGAHSQYRY